MEYLCEDSNFDKENLNVNNIGKHELDYIDNIYSVKNIGITEEEELAHIRKSHETIFSAWINELVSPELLEYYENEIKSLCYSINKEKEKQIMLRSERNYRDMIERVESDLINIHIYRSSCALRMYLRQRILKISEYPDFSIANSRLEGERDENEMCNEGDNENENKTNGRSFPNISEEEATFALKLSRLQWKYLDDVVSKMKNTLATDNNVPIPSPSFHRVVRFQCKDSAENDRLELGSLENSVPTQFEDCLYNKDSNNDLDGIENLPGSNSDSQNETEQTIDIEKGKIYTSKYEDIRNFLIQGRVQLWPWPPIISNRK
ncbi:hypothetical protein FG379_001781 [Cryptosporidium bovis]|uniref:uncharacterized protein n=1 Tax=Cryptosporidium bovis TaxID=310047 RepID=UPI00351AA73F|nr:hypothetical protein FG379_001781 [Cryptosporidium bovis]